MIPEEIDLDDLRRRIAERFEGMPPRGYVRGKGELRGAVVATLGCSEVEAEQLVDTMEARGLIRYGGDPSESVDRLEQSWSFTRS